MTHRECAAVLTDLGFQVQRATPTHVEATQGDGYTAIVKRRLGYAWRVNVWGPSVSIIERTHEAERMRDLLTRHLQEVDYAA